MSTYPNVLAALAVALFAAAAAAQPTGHPLVPGYPGSEVLKYETRAVDGYQVLTHPLENPSSGSSRDAQTYTTISGAMTRTAYASPKGARMSDVYHYYESELQREGFTILYNCAGQSCSPRSAGADFNALMTLDLRDQMLGRAKGQRYLAAERLRPDSKIRVTVYLVRDEPQSSGDENRVLGNVVVVETPLIPVN